MILTIRSDQPEAEVGLYDQHDQLQYIKWQAHRELAETIHQKIGQMLKAQKRDWQDITGVVVYQGPGSFTGLRIGVSVANAIAYGLGIPVAGARGEAWLEDGQKQLAHAKKLQPVVPEYGSPPHITQPKK